MHVNLFVKRVVYECIFDIQLVDCQSVHHTDGAEHPEGGLLHHRKNKGLGEVHLLSLTPSIDNKASLEAGNLS
jgi:hypothetical protein